MKARYVNSPSYKSAEQSLLVIVAWVFVGLGVLVLLGLVGAFRLEEDIPAVDNVSASQTYEVR